jgi:predicted DNA-binding transcriptional regulator YafY
MNIRSRQDIIVRTLRRNSSATVYELAVAVDASRRTVLRDICALRDQGFVIHSECGPGGGVQLDPRSIQTAARITVAEIFALLISVATLRTAQTFPFSALADAGLAKIERALPPDKVKDLRSLLDCLHIGQLSPMQDISELGPIDADLLPVFETAFLQRRLMKFQYRDAANALSHRQVEPQAMLILPPIWYLVAWDPARADFRRFRMDRISHPEEISASSFRRRHVPFKEDICPFAAAKPLGTL